MEHSEGIKTEATTQDPAIGGNWLLSAPRPTPARVPTADERAAIRAVQAMPGKIDRTICGVCGERMWDAAVPLSGMCGPCWQSWFDAREGQAA